MGAQERTQTAAAAADVTPDVEERQNSFVLVHPTCGNAKEECNLRRRENEIT
jgi:hypothetical protein